MDFCEIRLSELPKIVQSISTEIVRSGFKPNKIVFIERAGLIPGYLINHLIGGELISVEAKRHEGKTKKIFGSILPVLPKAFRSLLRRIELGKYKKDVKRIITLDSSMQFSKKDLILIVDDSMDSGYTIAGVKQNLEERGAEVTNIKIFVINTTILNDLVKPDFLIAEKKIFSFPWSQDSNEYKKFLEYFIRCKRGEITPSQLWGCLTNEI